MYAPHTVTLYYVTEDKVTFENTNYITVLEGVFVDSVKGANVRASGLENADSVNLYIPFDVNATDGITGATKTFLPPKQYEAQENKYGYWTLDVSGNCFFVKGVVVEPTQDFQYINLNYDDVHRVTKVDMKDFGSEHMRHWEVGGA